MNCLLANACGNIIFSEDAGASYPACKHGFFSEKISLTVQAGLEASSFPAKNPSQAKSNAPCSKKQKGFCDVLGFSLGYRGKNAPTPAPTYRTISPKLWRANNIAQVQLLGTDEKTEILHRATDWLTAVMSGRVGY